MNLTQAQLKELAGLADTLQGLPEEAREGWLARLGPQQAMFGPALRQLLHAGTPQTRDFLATLPKLSEAVEDDASGHAPGAEIGPYRLLRELGRGGMGTVWLAERSDGTLKRTVALKLPHSALPQRRLAERFARERDILSALTHPNIARLYDAGVTAQGRPYLALEYVEGEPLLSYCDARRLNLRGRIGLLLQALTAVQYAHGQLVVHRDLKPSNILVTAQGEVRLLDFGIAKLLTDGAARETELTQLGGRALTTRYASPEQITGQPIGTASDVYALGVILYEMLTGVLPYRLTRDSRGALEDAILTGEPTRPSKVADDAALADRRGTSPSRLARSLRGDLDTIILKALKKSPHERYATADAFAADLRRFLAGKPVQARPDSAWYRARKFLLRNRWEVGIGAGVFAAFGVEVGFGATAMAMLALAVGLVAAMWQAREARRQARIAGAAAATAQAEAVTARAALDFVKHIFQTNSTNQPDPRQARQTTARQLLDIGASDIDSALDEAPAAKAEVLGTLGDLYYDLGLREKAIELHRKRLEATRRSAGATDLRVAEAAMALCRMMAQEFQAPVVEEREALLAETERILDHHRDEASELRARFWMQKGYLAMVRDAPTACEYAEKAVAIYRRLPPDAAAVEAFGDYGFCRLNLGQPEAARALLREGLALASAVGARANEHLPQVYTALGNAEMQLGDMAGAVANHRRAYETACRYNGERHINSVFAGAFLGRALLGACLYREAAKLLEQILETALAVRGPDDTVVLPLPLFSRGLALARIGRLDEGLVAIDRAIAMLGNRSAIASVRRIETQAGILTMQGKFAAAEALYEEALESRRKNALDTGEGADAHWEGRANLLLATNRPEAARRTMEQSSIPRAEESRRADPARTLLDARIAFALGEQDSAEALAREAVAHISADAQRESKLQREADAEALLGRICLERTRPQEALAHLSRAEKLLTGLVDSEWCLGLADVEVHLGECHLRLGQLDLARSCADRAERIHAMHSQVGPQYRAPLEALRQALTRIAPAQSGT